MPCEVRFAAGFRAEKNKVTLLFVANILGSLKLTPILLYHSQTTGVLKGLNN